MNLTIRTIFVITAVMWAGVLMSFMFVYFVAPEQLQFFGQIADALGVVNSALTIITLIAVLQANQLQQKQLDHTKQAVEAEKEKDRIQAFEAIFFQLLQSMRQQSETFIYYRDIDNPITGHQGINLLYRALFDVYHQMDFAHNTDTTRRLWDAKTKACHESLQQFLLSLDIILERVFTFSNGDIRKRIDFLRIVLSTLSGTQVDILKYGVHFGRLTSAQSDRIIEMLATTYKIEVGPSVPR